MFIHHEIESRVRAALETRAAKSAFRAYEIQGLREVPKNARVLSSTFGVGDVATLDCMAKKSSTSASCSKHYRDCRLKKKSSKDNPRSAGTTTIVTEEMVEEVSERRCEDEAVVVAVHYRDLQYRVCAGASASAKTGAISRADFFIPPQDLSPAAVMSRRAATRLCNHTFRVIGNLNIDMIDNYSSDRSRSRGPRDACACAAALVFDLILSNTATRRSLATRSLFRVGK
ncbi:hypothetical protein EVAR_22810_1 [Eumeta japonica]|uniref:Uncharacterized protein n=1 Tax=Eumeta variegata TaxID=151549 RepID=A0A4C1VFI4_EUMVA|nr:hypothetical protein EVAR_22810_1 [Eumeta japonica]